MLAPLSRSDVRYFTSAAIPRTSSATTSKPQRRRCHVGEFYLSIESVCRRPSGTKATPYAGAHRSFGFVPISAKVSADIGPIRARRQGSLYAPPQYDRRTMKASRGIRRRSITAIRRHALPVLFGRRGPRTIAGLPQGTFLNARWSEDQSAAKPCQPARVHAGSSGSSPIFCLAPSRCRSASPMRRSPGRPISATFSSGFWHFAGSTRQCRPSPSRAGLIRATAGSFVGLAFGAGSPRRFRHAAYGETDRPVDPRYFIAAGA